MPRDTFKKIIRYKSRLEMFADLLEVTLHTMTYQGVDPLEVMREVERRQAVRSGEARRRASEPPSIRTPKKS